MENERSKYRAIIHLVNGKYSMDEDMLVSSLQTLSQLLCRHYGQKAIILIDEYDVPLDKAFQHGYYKEMVSLIRGLFGQALKTNDDLQFAVLTGCLRVSKESIFTGLNNFKVYAADDVRYDEEFGFTNKEIKKLLANYNLQEHFGKVKEWYDGYRFGNADIYCPWDVINYVDDLVSDPNVQPKSYWINSSGNDLVKRFIEQADITTKDEIEQLIAGNAVEKRIRPDLTYNEIDNSIDNIWSVLFTTGYLTRLGKAENGVYKLIIPNQEVREVFVLQIREWFNQTVANNRASTDKINQGFLEGEVETIQQELTMFLGETISVFDTKARNEEKEIFYHGILLGILKNYSGWVVKSNRESGDGFADILLKPKNPDAGIIVELKYARSLHDLDQACERALEQIEDRRYDTELREDGRNDILAYGIAFCRKRCKVVVKNYENHISLGSIDDYPRYVRAGADELFCGYVPFSWSEKYGTVLPLNRREVLNYNVQIGSFSELEILANMVQKYQKPVHLTFNSLYYRPEQYEEIAQLIQQCRSIGFDSYILADPALLVYLRKEKINCEVHLSGDLGTVNSAMTEVFAKEYPKRIIFQRKNTISEMRAVIRHITAQKEAARKEWTYPTEFEAFALNELCQFSGAFCNSLHCDEMGYLCRVPYWKKPVSLSESKLEKQEKKSSRRKYFYIRMGFCIRTDESCIGRWLPLRRNRLRPVYIKTAFRCWNHSSEAGRPGKLYRFYGA